MSDDKNEIFEVSLSEKDMTPLNEFRKWIQEHPEYPQKISKIFLKSEILNLIFFNFKLMRFFYDI